MKTIILNRLKQYLVTFVSQNTILESIFDTIANIFKTVYDDITVMKTSYYTGRGLRMSLDEHSIVYRKNDSEANLQTKYDARYTILKQRGTEQGIKSEISNLLDINTNRISLYGYDECGIILGRTYIGVDPQAVLGLFKALVIYGNIRYITEEEGYDYMTEDFEYIIDEETTNFKQYADVINRQLIPIDTFSIIIE